MVKAYIHINQLNNFLINKEPVDLVIVPPNENYIECLLNTDKLIFTEYNTHITIELKTFRKVWKSIWKKKKTHKNKKRK